MAEKENLTKRDIILSIYKDNDLPQKQVREIVQKTLDVIAEALTSGRNVELRNFGVFEVQLRKKRIGRNPNKPEEDVVIPERAVIKFKAGKELKNQLTQMNIQELKN
ncbi:MAG: integration host factor subunit beta [Verrucomicrobia bacterium CG_4_10_14_3_um_filter_43_23]|nr:MAG: integration host factor subunit beta [Verrucomicrobia bacterium CG1_02_43_26]PIP58679.1 MAG: integration host factor subunit beta [Verrucomicrobia bacterium CG22_combo_CG10-13_8_21_14_all_43_17]PIX58080.1 MAG: integration host factor subunit beta [Verrucomicrobia bacterium CG_4_10_14_3_um_filter_43_23]PIY61175.1 MAG: integration host factor subunit beta [Verrucomicrobia bacterium CG_4_10_14_0_8_um_filter_43_34]PJA43348.1 MAG: integration host factor subunit beta [Verrucomicrobia bacteri